MILSQYVKICVGSSQYVVMRSWRLWCIAIIFARSIFCNLGILFAILRFSKGLYMPYLAFSCFQCPSVVSLGGLHDPYV